MELELGLALPYHNPNPNPNPNPMMIQDSETSSATTLSMHLWPDDKGTQCHDEEMEIWKEASSSSSPKHVKVKMEGVGIGRKVDLRKCASYHALALTLIHMFSKYSNIERDWEEYSVLSQDKEGDWTLLGEDDHVHVQWELFVDSVQRIHIILNNNNNNNNNNMGFRLLSHK